MGLSKEDVARIPNPTRVDILKVCILPALEQGRDGGSWDMAIGMIEEWAVWGDLCEKHNVEIEVNKEDK